MVMTILRLSGSDYHIWDDSCPKFSLTANEIHPSAGSRSTALRHRVDTSSCGVWNQRGLFKSPDSHMRERFRDMNPGFV